MSIWFEEKYCYQFENRKPVSVTRGEWLHRGSLTSTPRVKYSRKYCNYVVMLKFAKNDCLRVGYVHIKLDYGSEEFLIQEKVSGLCAAFVIPEPLLQFKMYITLAVHAENSRRNVCVFDYIVVGLGTAGSIVANALANKNAGDSTVLGLEWGPNANDDPVVTTPFQFNPDSGTINLLTAVDQAGIAQVVQSGPEGDIGQDGRIRNRIGMMLGGSAGKNLLFAVHGTPEYHEDLAANFTVGGTWDNWKDLYEAVEEYRGTSADTMNDCRGDKGKIVVTQAAIPDPVFPAGVALAEEAGVPLVDDFNDCVNACVGKVGQQFLNFSMGPPQRSFGGTSYLGPNVIDQGTGVGIGDWEKLLVRVDSPVRRLLIDADKNVIGVEVVQNEAQKITYYYAKKCVVSCAGAIWGPALLQRSGIGPLDVLEEIGAEPVHLNDNVGAHYTDHYGALVQVETTQEFTNLPVGFADVDPTGINVGGTRRGVQYQFVGGLGVDQGYAASQNLVPGPGRNFFQMLSWNLRPQSRGSVKATSLDPAARVDFKFNAYQNADDLAVARNAIFLAKRMVDNLNATFGPGTYKIVYPLEADIDEGDPAKLDGYIRGSPQVTDHPCGTCQFDDQNPNVAVCDSKLNVLGVQRLKQADLSVFPLIADGNTCLPAYIVGVKVVELITGLSFGKENPI